MKKLLRTFVLNIIALRIAMLIIDSLNFAGGLKTILLTALALTIFEYLLKPVAKILFLPINVLTLGTLRWIINVIGLYLVTMFVNDFSIMSYNFPGSNWNGFIIPSINFSILVTYVIVSLFINLVVTSLKWVFKK